MNITKSSYFTCVTSKENPYLDTITFKPAKDSKVFWMQVSFMFDRLTCVTNAVPYILTEMKKQENGSWKPSQFYLDIMKLVEDFPSRYNCTKKQLKHAYNASFKAINKINDAYLKSKCVSDVIFKYGMTVLNNKFMEDSFNRSVDLGYFIDGMLKMAQSFEKLAL